MTPSTVSTNTLKALRARTTEMVDKLAMLVGTESPSADIGATAACADLTDELALELLGTRAERLVLDDRRTHLRWRFGNRSIVVLIGHIDTVWPLSTVQRWPFRIDGHLVTGPGCFDMKAGVVQLLFALSSLDDLDGVAVVLTTDEELGSPTSAELIESTTRGAKAALVLEPSAGGALKTERKGAACYRVRVTGRAAHAGLEPERGANAALEVSHQVLAVSSLGRPERGTTVTPTLLSAGETSNTVPADASLSVDVRASSNDEAERVEAELRQLQSVIPGTTLRVENETRRPPLPRSASAELFVDARRLAEELGLSTLREASVGGGSDGNLTAGIGVPTLDGLGAVGGAAHAEGEYVVVPAMPERAALVSSLVAQILARKQP